MSGFITKQNLLEVAKAFGLKAAIKLIFAREKTFLDFCRNNGWV